MKCLLFVYLLNNAQTRGKNWREIQNFKLQNVLMVNVNVKQMLRGEIAIVADKEPTACRK